MDNFSSTDLSSSPKRGRYRKRSEIWKFFVQVDNENEISPIKCIICGKQFSFKSTASNLYRHLNRCHNVEATSLVKHSTQKNYNPQLPRLLSQNNISLFKVRSDSMHEFANKSLKIPFSDTTARSYLREHAKLMREMVFRQSTKKTPFNLCFDGWTNITGRHIYAFIYRGESPYTCVFMKQEHRDGVQSAEWLADVIQKIRLEMIILNRNLISCTSDNAAVCVKALTLVNERKDLARVVHHRCVCHGLSLLVGEVIKYYKVEKLNKRLVSKIQEIDKKYSPLSYTPTRWGSMLKTMEGLVKKAECEKVNVSNAYVELMTTIRTITLHIFPLESDKATLFDEYNELITMTEELKRLRTDSSLYALKMYINYYYPYLIDKSGLVVIAGYLNPKTLENVREMYDVDISIIEKNIIDIAYGWNIPLTLKYLENYLTKTFPFNFNEKLAGKEAWEELVIRNDTQETQIMYSFVKTLLTVSPSETCVERLFSIEKQIHTSIANRMSPQRVEDTLFLRYNSKLIDILERGTG